MRGFVAGCGLAGAACGGFAQNPATADAEEFPDLAALARIEIVTATKRPERLADLPAAVSVLTGDDVRRLGAPSVPDALRWVPGLDVTRIAGSSWGVGSRGFGGQFANQLLVLEDGRSLYHPAFGGVLWVSKSFFLPDLERIEVVRGPGGTLWGANAVNGVINLLMKDAHQTLGGLAYAGGGGEPVADFGVRYGFLVAPETAVRVFAKQENFDGITPFPAGEPSDHWGRGQAGFRLDHHGAAGRLTLLGGATFTRQYTAAWIKEPTPPTYGKLDRLPVRTAGAHVLGKWTGLAGAGAGWSVQAYWDYISSRNTALTERRHTVDLDVQHGGPAGERHDLTYGLGVRVSADRIDPTADLRMRTQPSATETTANLFVQDNIALQPGRWHVLAGTKLEHHPSIGWALQPSVRLLHHPAASQTVWAAVSRAVTIPGRLTRDVTLDLRYLPPGALGPGSPATLTQVRGMVAGPEKLIAVEGGWRGQLAARLTLDVVLFQHRYEDLQALSTGAPVFTSSPPVLPLTLANGPSATTWGGAVVLAWEPLRGVPWRWHADYTYFESDLNAGSVGRATSGGSPRHKVNLRTAFDVGPRWKFDAGARFVDALPALAVPGYVALDARVEWSPAPGWSVAVIGRNLADPSHPESPPGLSTPLAEIPRSVHAELTWRF